MRLRILLSILALIILITAFAILNSQADNDIAQLLRLPLKLGEQQFVPGQILLGICITLVLLALSRSLTKLLEVKLREKRESTRASNIEAIVTLTSYGLVCLAVLVGISTAGIDLSSLAIIAGALSVGIGFGLQNIVSNFISGIILLIEQPIKSGDFIQVNGIEGFVRKVRIRGTEVVTFDYSTVIVPNSELISGAVTNWNLNNDYARVSVTVGVAYGSDVRKVQQLLQACADEHPMVVSNAEMIVPKPTVTFTEFGDSSLNFKLSCYIQDAEKRFGVTSDLRFAIDATFRENGVSIPFPQRDVHMIKAAGTSAAD